MRREVAGKPYRAVAIILLLAVILLAHQVLVLPGESRLHVALKNASHVPMFFLLAVMAWYMLRRHRGFAQGAALAATGGVCLFLSILTEAIQFFTPRDASPGDVALDLMGTASALFLLHALDLNMRRPGGGAVWMGLGALVFFAGFSQVYLVLWTYHQRASIAPRLLDVEAGIHLRATLGGKWNLARAPADWPGFGAGTVLDISFSEDSRYPGIRLREPYRDWNGRDRLVMDYYLPGDTPLPVTVRVETERDRGQDTRVETSLLPGPNRLGIPIGTLIEGDGAGRLPLVKNLLIFSNGQYSDRRYFLGGLRLE